MTGTDDGPNVSRRLLLRATGGTVALSSVGVAGASGTDDAAVRSLSRCPDATLRPSHGYCEGASTEGCADDHPVTVDLRDAVRDVLESRFPDVGALVDAGFRPYFDVLDRDEDGWSHWLSPEYIGDDAVLDPERPESVLVDNRTWRAIGVMFIATRDGDPIAPPPVYEGEEAWDGDVDDRDRIDLDERPDRGPDGDRGHGEGDHREDGHGEGDHHEDGHGHDEDDHHDEEDHEHDDDHEHGPPPADDADRCSPWHYHAGLPGRSAWWYYRTTESDGDLALPCRTPCMMHVWTVDHPDGVYAHGGPPAENRPDDPADDPGFDTDATPGEDLLERDALPDALVPDRPPDTGSLRDRFGL